MKAVKQNKARCLGLVMVSCLIMAGATSPAMAAQETKGMELIPAGTFAPFFIRKSDKDVTSQPMHIDAFWLDAYPVTNQQYKTFVVSHPEWGKSGIKEVFTDPHYLAHWSSDRTWSSPHRGDQPVTNVSWFAAKAYCEAQGKTLPTTDQWEYVLADQGRNQDRVRDRALAWYGQTNQHNIPIVDNTTKNGFGIYAMVGVIWEWTLDFNSSMTGSELRDNDGKDKGMFCGAGSAGVKDATDYASFMRYALRSSLRASYVTDNLGFRCVREIYSER